MSLGKWILGGLGFAVGGPIGALIGVFIASLFDSSHTIEAGEHRQGIPRPGRSHTTQGDIRVSIIVLLACVIKADGRVLGVAIKDRKGYTILVENGSPKLQTTMTMVHEMVHIWQYLNWDMEGIRRTYGEDELEIYEGMAKWVEIQYAYLIGEPAAAKREEICARVRDDEYGRGFRRYVEKYPLSTGTHLEYATPFEKPDAPL